MGQCLIVEGADGGEVETWIEADVELPILGRPVLSVAPALMDVRAVEHDIRVAPMARAQLSPSPTEAA